MVHIHFERVVLAALLVACWPIDSAEAQPLAATAPAAFQANASAPLPCVLLRNDNVLFGHAVQVGEYVIVRTGRGGEVQLPRTEVVCWANSTRDLYRYRVDHRQPGDVGAHLRDARWCLDYELFDLVAEEIQIIKKLDPRNTQVRSIEDTLQRRTSRTPTAHSHLVMQPEDVQPANFEEAGPEIGSVDLATLRAFASRVQPMLLNRCAQCHSQHTLGNDPTRWTLVTPPAGARASSRMTRENLAASIPYINRDAFEESELLLKATTAHGGGETPLDARNAKAVNSLKAWLMMAVRALPEPSSSPETPQTTAAQTSLPVETPVVAERPRMTELTSQPELRGSQPTRLPQVSNPFDPDLFNRRFHPHADKPARAASE